MGNAPTRPGRGIDWHEKGLLWIDSEVTVLTNFLMKCSMSYKRSSYRYTLEVKAYGLRDSVRYRGNLLRVHNVSSSKERRMTEGLGALSVEIGMLQ